jgi:hypothetical protein
MEIVAGYKLYTRGDYAVLPADDTNLETNYSESDYTDVATNDTDRVNQSATDEYAIHQYKEYADVSVENNNCHVIWIGQTDIDPATSPVYLQIYNQTTHVWETINGTPAPFGGSYALYSGNTTYYGSQGADVDFRLDYSITDLTNYKDGSNLVSFRLYQLDV